MKTNTQPSEAINTRLKLEAEIADFLRQRIDDGDLNLEDIPLRLARYGLMDPEAFAAEMRERMGMDMDDEAYEIHFHRPELGAFL
ncbi:TPA: hypothetical protein L5G07_001491 [Pseudomonas aeruginosa]|uniref:hypothetical protein n=1 Tax=Pseudomonadota TaxID=1224 RepID=UPI0003321393|nr:MULTISPECIES: hypothetical protein [Pseudomonadota]RFP98898.1 hypothetical protein D0O09_25670 [Pseudomonas putida]ARI02431.1 hypothetical protein Y880_02500 [Pseudomonas aeruginosa PAK]EIU1410618.1 hypothetical protein [Pseudomonas aeruginosa]EKU7420006.1 hypothetical protein [Pseudomonas aeruginosa]EOT19951.1 hypothetical protein PAK_02421 [Pseudomonas aeruginosa PAK]